MAQNEVTLKLLIDTNSQRVLFGEADKSVVDFLFHLLSLPLGTVCDLLKGQKMIGCLENLYESVETLNQTYLEPNNNIQTLLKPKISSYCSNNSTMLLPYNTDPTPLPPCTEDPSPFPKFYVCSSNISYKCCNYMSDDPKAVCPQCRNTLSGREMTYVKGPKGSTKKKISSKDEGLRGYVKGVVTYMVMDDLSVIPMSTISSITLLNKFNIKDVGALVEKHITLNVNEGVKLLKASLQSNTVLTNVFLERILKTPKIATKGKKATANPIKRGKKRKSRK